LMIQFYILFVQLKVFNKYEKYKNTTH